MNKSIVFTNFQVGYRKLICPNTIAIIEIPFAISTDKDLIFIALLSFFQLFLIFLSPKKKQVYQ